MPVIICNFQMFDKAQYIYLKDEDSTSLLGFVVNNQVANSIAEFCSMYGVENVHLFGVSDYVDHYGDKIRKIAINNYNMQNINVELN